MNKSDFKGKKITIMGIGLHGGGVAAVRFFAEAGANVIATDIKSEKELASSILKLKDLKNVTFVFGQHRIEDFENVDMVVKGPAVPWSSKHIQAALKKKIPVEMDSSIFVKLCKFPIIGVTGTKGKTTTSTLIAEILKEARKNVFTVGVGQKPVLNMLSEMEKAKDGVVVFELSSWRLSALGRTGMSPQVAVVTNIYPDHLNYYGSMGRYIADKNYILSNQRPGDFAILNFDDSASRELAKGVKSNLVYYSSNRNNLDKVACIEDDKFVFEADGKLIEICKREEIKIRGDHNLHNILAAIAVACVRGIPAQKICMALKNFKGVPHRLEFVRERNGVKYYNDTAATMPDAAIAGINSFAENIILIAGGADKKLEFSEFAKIIKEKVKKVILLKGEATEKIKAELKKINAEKIIDSEFDSMEKAVIRAKSISGPGDVVLLSPGAASFGLFLNEFDRGDRFREAVGRL